MVGAGLYQESFLLDPSRTWHVQPPNLYFSLLSGPHDSFLTHFLAGTLKYGRSCKQC